jgi:hypothetical protein
MRNTEPAGVDGMHSAHLYRDSLLLFCRRPDWALLLVAKKGEQKGWK